VRALRRSCLLVLLAAAGARAADSPAFADPTSPPYPIWPIPQEAAYENDRLLLGDATIVVPPGDERAQLPGRMLAEIVADHFGAVIPVVEGAAPQGRTPIVVGELSHAVVAGAPWGALEELLLGKLQVPEAAFSINLLWSRHYPAREAALEQVGLLMPEVRRLVSGRLPDGRPAVVWASEWTNPRPDVPIASVALVGSPGPSDARPILIGVTAVAKPRVEDYR